MTGDVVHFERKSSVAVVTICRPERMNALNREVFVHLGLLFESIAEEFWSDVSRSPRSIILTGAGERAFSAGADLHEILEVCRCETDGFVNHRSKRSSNANWKHSSRH